MEEVKDLNKAVFNKSFDNNQISYKNISNVTERFTSIDIRIYALEKAIKKDRNPFRKAFKKDRNPFRKSL